MMNIKMFPCFVLFPAICFGQLYNSLGMYGGGNGGYGNLF